jgi:hypothetical protein
MNIKVSNTNGNGNTRTAVRVYMDGVMVAEVFPTARNPLRYIQSHNGKYRSALLEQCKAAGMTDDLISQHLGV